MEKGTSIASDHCYTKRNGRAPSRKNNVFVSVVGTVELAAQQLPVVRNPLQPASIRARRAAEHSGPVGGRLSFFVSYFHEAYRDHGCSPAVEIVKPHAFSASILARQDSYIRRACMKFPSICQAPCSLELLNRPSVWLGAVEVFRTSSRSTSVPSPVFITFCV